MEPAAEFTLATLLALSAHLHDGSEALAKKDYARATTELTAVVDAKLAPDPMPAAARLLRAEAHAGAGRNDAALADLRHVATHDVPLPLRHQAREAWTKAGGDPAKLLPAITPVETLDALRAAVAREDHPAAIARVGGRLMLMLRAIADVEGSGHEAEMMTGMLEQLGNMRVVLQTADQEAGRVTLSVRNDSERGVLTMQQDGDVWLLTDYKMLGPVFGADGGPDEPAVAGEVRVPGSPPGVAAPGAPAANPVTTNAPELPPALRDEADRWIATLREGDAAARADARRRLKAMGAAIRPLLESRKNDPDPEIAASVRELLER